MSWVGLMKSSCLKNCDSNVGGPLTCLNALCTQHGKSWLEIEALLDRYTTQEDVSVHLESDVFSHQIPKWPPVLFQPPKFHKSDHVTYMC